MKVTGIEAIPQEPILARNGTVAVPERPELGLVLDEKAVARYRVS